MTRFIKQPSLRMTATKRTFDGLPLALSRWWKATDTVPRSAWHTEIFSDYNRVPSRALAPQLRIA